jgi:GDPmannose 4,6-dehydratase
MKVALITGITGQDGSYLTELLLEKGYEVHGIKRRSSSLNTDRIDHLYQDPHDPNQRLKLHYGDLSDAMNLTRIIKECQPDEIYNLGAMSHVKVSFDTPEYVGDIDGLGVLRILEAVRLLGLEKKTRIYQAATSEMYGGMPENKNEKGLYDENSPFHPRSPYGVAKIYGFWITKNYREAYNMFACNGILFNHESPRRGETFVTRKITRATARIALGLQDKLYLGNLDAQRDWGHAKDYVRMMWMILQAEAPEDWVIATGKATTVRAFVRMSFAEVGITLRFEGEGANEVGIIDSINQEKYQSILNPNSEQRTTNNEQRTTIGKVVLSVDPTYFRPTEVDVLIGDPTKAKEKLGWAAAHDLASLVKDMMQSDVKLMQKEQYLKAGGYHANKNLERLAMVVEKNRIRK